MPAKGARSGVGKYRSIKHLRMYRALRRKGYSKQKSACISNARARGGGRGRRKRK